MVKLPIWARINWKRAQNRLLDLRARLVGACNADTWDPLRKTYIAGYANWRCMLSAKHAGPHRANNYTWWYRGESQFDPLPLGMAKYLLTHRKWTEFRHNVKPRGRERAWRREMDLQAALRRARGRDMGAFQDLVE